MIAEESLVAEELGRDEFEKLRREWDEVVGRSGRDAPFSRHYWLRTWIDNFAPDARLRLFVARSGPRLIAALPLVEERASMYGVAVRRLRAPANVHSNRFDLVCEHGRLDAVRAIWSHLRATADFDVIELPDVPPEGVARALLPMAEADGLGVATWESMRTPYIPLDGGYPAVTRRLDGHFRANLRRRRRKLEARGRVALERVAGGRDLERCLEEAFLLEGSGWKGRDGTAIANDSGTRGFYAELAREASLRDALALYFLRLDGRPVAFQFGLQWGRTYYLPKTGYAEPLHDCSPGQLLQDEVLRDCCERGLEEFDFLGPSMSWKRDWTASERPHHWLYVFARGPRGRLLQRLKSSWVPAAKEVLRWKQ